VRGVRLLYFGLLPVLVISLLVVLPSISRPLSNKSAYWQRKKYPDGHLLCMSRSISRPLTPLSLSLPPESTIVILRLAIWYVPRLLGTLSMTSLVYLFQVVQRAIPFSLRTVSLQPCYNSMMAGGLEPPKAQGRRVPISVCMPFQHAVRFENLEGESLLANPPSKLPYEKHIPDDTRLSSVICGKYEPDGIINSEFTEADMARLVRMCPSCRSRRMKKYDTYRYGDTSRTRYKCQNCGRLTIYPLMKLVAERKKKT